MSSQNNYNFQNIHEKTNIFDPSVEVKNILKLPSNERKLALENFYKNLEKYHADLVGVFNFARTEFGDLDLSNKTESEIDAEIEIFLKKFAEKIQNFDEKTKSKILEWIAKYTENKKNAYKKLKEFEENPLKFLQENGMGMKLKWRKLEVDLGIEKMPKVKASVYKGNFVLQIPESEKENFGMTEGALGDHNTITDVIRVVIRDDIDQTLIHENQHAENRIFLADDYIALNWMQEIVTAERNDIDEITKEKGLRGLSREEDDLSRQIIQRSQDYIINFALVRFKDEVLAQLKWGTYPENLSMAMFYYYDYFSEYKASEWIYGKLRWEYFKRIQKYLFEIKKLVRNGVSLDILAVTPMEKWGRLLEKSKDYSEKLQEKFVFENIKKLENGNFFAKKIYENGEVWEGVFDENKRFLEWKKMGGDAIQEWKFFDKNNISRGKNNENLSFGMLTIPAVTLYGEFFENGLSLLNGVMISQGHSIREIKNGSDSGKTFRMKNIDLEKKIFSGAWIRLWKNDVLVIEKWDFIYENGNLKLKNGEIIIKKSELSNFGKLTEKLRLQELVEKLHNFFPTKQIKIRVNDGEINKDMKSLDVRIFRSLNNFFELDEILWIYAYGTNKAKNNFKNLISKIL